MSLHYSKPKGFVGRSIIYAITPTDSMKLYGFITANSAILYLHQRDTYFGYDFDLNSIVNNQFFRLIRIAGKYPMRNFSSVVLREYRERVCTDWFNKYGDNVVGFETLVQPPLTGNVYIRDSWDYLGMTKGYTCKRISALDSRPTDSWSGSRIWNTTDLVPKLIFCKKV